jgi:hypothetical protein
MLVLSQHYRQPTVVVGRYDDPLEAELIREVVARADYTAKVWIMASPIVDRFGLILLD